MSQTRLFLSLFSEANFRSANPSSHQPGEKCTVMSMHSPAKLSACVPELITDVGLFFFFFSLLARRIRDCSVCHIAKASLRSVSRGEQYNLGHVACLQMQPS